MVVKVFLISSINSNKSGFVQIKVIMGGVCLIIDVIESSNNYGF